MSDPFTDQSWACNQILNGQTPVVVCERETLRTALDAAEAKLAAIDGLHQRSDERRRWDLSLKPIPHCSFDGEPWPCDTYRILHSKDD